MRTIRTRDGSRLHRALTVTLAETVDRQRAEASRLCWGQHVALLSDPGTFTEPLPIHVYRLTPLGILHALTGVTLQVDVRP